MRPPAVALLACPECGGALALEARERADDGHVMEGSLTCGGCRRSYAVRRGVPRLVAAGVTHASSVTADRFATEWTTFDHDGEYQEEWLRAWLDPIGPDDLRRKRVLEGGCGMGRHTRVVAAWGARDVVALDLGSAVEVAFARTRHLPNAHVVQGDLLHPPVQRCFDVAFSIGVLHHVPDPRAGFEALVGRVVEGGLIAIWVYGAERNEWITRFVNPIRERVTSRLPHRALFWLTWAPSYALSAGLACYRLPVLASRLPDAPYLKRLARLPAREVHVIVYDQLTPPIAYYLPGDEVRRWFDRPGLTDVRVAWHNANSWRACARITAGTAG